MFEQLLLEANEQIRSQSQETMLFQFFEVPITSSIPQPPVTL
jgi:hypothetical protein